MVDYGFLTDFLISAFFPKRFEQVATETGLTPKRFYAFTLLAVTSSASDQ